MYWFDRVYQEELADRLSTNLIQRLQRTPSSMLHATEWFARSFSDLDMRNCYVNQTESNQALIQSHFFEDVQAIRDMKINQWKTEMLPWIKRLVDLSLVKYGRIESYEWFRSEYLFAYGKQKPDRLFVNAFEQFKLELENHNWDRYAEEPLSIFRIQLGFRTEFSYHQTFSLHEGAHLPESQALQINAHLSSKNLEAELRKELKKIHQIERMLYAIWQSEMKQAGVTYWDLTEEKPLEFIG